MNQTLMKTTLLSNVLFSVTTSLICLLASESISALTGEIAPWIIQLIGAGLLLFAIDVFWVATRKEISLKLSKLIMFADWGWVIGTFLLLPFISDYLTPEGTATLICIAVIVGIFAWLEGLAMRKSSASTV